MSLYARLFVLRLCGRIRPEQRGNIYLLPLFPLLGIWCTHDGPPLVRPYCNAPLDHQRGETMVVRRLCPFWGVVGGGHAADIRWCGLLALRWQRLQ